MISFLDKMKFLLFQIILLFLSFYFVRANNIKIPSFPKVPKIKKLNKKKSKIKFINYHVNLFLNKGSKVKGIIQLKNKYITVYIKKGDFSFIKRLSLNKILQIEIIEWKSSLITDNAKLWQSYIFYPIKYKIITTDDKKYIYRGRLKFLEKLKLKHLLGNVIVYAIFYDYWIKKTKKWENSKTNNFNFNIKNPNPLTLKKIRFDHLKKFNNYIKN